MIDRTGLRRIAGRPFSGWLGRLLLLSVAFRVLFPVAVLARSPDRLLPGLPHYRYNPLEGDAYGYYFGAREILDTWRRDATTMLPVAFLAVVAALAAWRFLRGARRTVALLWVAGAFVGVICALIRFTGAAQIGWPLVWSLPLLPYRALGLPLDPDIAFGVALVILLACNAITVIATYELALITGARRGVAVLAGALIAFWPLLSLLTGPNAAKNGTWQIDLGLSLYTEPISTALVLVGLVVVLRRSSGTVSALIGGALLGLAVLVRLSNGLIAATVVALLLITHERGRALAVSLGGLAFAPAVALYYPKSYPKLKPPVFPAHPFALRYARDAWTQSLLWHPAVLVVLVPLALLGLVTVRSRGAAVLAISIGVTAAFYSFYQLTPIHPRFLFVVLPMLFILWAAGAAAVTARVRGLYDRAR
ncbi:MAG: hypothetical protein WAU41_13365 [Gaiellaceae bacterium]